MRFAFEPDATSVLMRVDGPSGEWVLRRRVPSAGRERYEIILNGKLLMDSSEGSSEEALARVALGLLPDRGAVQALVGGLGFGFTLGPLLASDRVAGVEVVEIEPALPGLVSGLQSAGAVSTPPLSDPRVRIRLGDVREVVGRADRQYDCVLLDVDNGPDSLALDGNAGLYAQAGLSACLRALRPAGVLCIWSEGPSAGCLERLRSVFGNADSERVRVVRDGRSFDPHILFARRLA